MFCISSLPIIYDVQIDSIRPNGATISWKVELSDNDTDIEYFLHPKYIQIHAKDLSFSGVVVENELIPLKDNQIEYSHKTTTLQSNCHYILNIELYTMEDMIMEYELCSNFEPPKSINFTTLDKFYWICCVECRYYAGLSIYNKIDDNIFRFIALFCSEFSFYGINNGILITDNGFTVQTSDKELNTSISLLFGNFLCYKDERKFLVTFKLENVKDNCISFGFATPEFEDFMSSSLQSNDSIYIMNKAYNSDNYKFGIILDQSDLLSIDFKSGQCITMVINMKKQIGLIYFSNNSTKPLLTVKLPEYVTMLVSFLDCTEQKITVTDCGFII